MKLTIEEKDVKKLTRSEMDLMNKWRRKEFGPNESKDFKKDFPTNTKFFFVKENNKIMAFTGLMPIKIKHFGKTYNILGICNLVSVKKKLGYGRILIGAMLVYIRKNKKSALGFTGQTIFCRKAGLGVKKDFIKRFRYKNPITGKIEIDNDGDGIYINGKDNFIKEILSTKSFVYIDIDFW
jgi:hypothetical protein